MATIINIGKGPISIYFPNFPKGIGIKFLRPNDIRDIDVIIYNLYGARIGYYNLRRINEKYNPLYLYNDSTIIAERIKGITINNNDAGGIGIYEIVYDGDYYTDSVVPSVPEAGGI